jgi:hypothetical protein
MVRLDAHATLDTCPRFIVRKVMKKVNGIVQNSLHVFVFLVAVALELRGPSELMNTDEKKNWLIAISQSHLYHRLL